MTRARLSGAAFAAAWIVLSLVFLSAATYKLFHFDAYTRGAAVMTPSWVPSSLALRAAAAVPVVELGAAAFLWVPGLRHVGAFLVSTLLLGFTALLLRLCAEGVLEHHCECNWTMSSLLTPTRTDTMLLRNVGLIVLAVWVAVVSLRHHRGDGTESPP